MMRVVLMSRAGVAAAQRNAATSNYQHTAGRGPRAERIRYSRTRGSGRTCRARRTWRACASGSHRGRRGGKAGGVPRGTRAALRQGGCPRPGAASAGRAPPSTEPSPLSAREAEVLRLVAGGLTSKEIGRRLFVAPSTVNQHVRSIFHKLGADTRAQAVAVAAQQGLL
jgi:DNA-binding CsgD family transcriptional regulator